MKKTTPAGVLPAGALVAYHVGGQGNSIRDVDSSRLPWFAIRAARISGRVGSTL